MATTKEPKVLPPPEPITQQQLDDYVSLASRAKSLDEQREAARDRIVSAMLAGHKLPKEGPYLLNLVRQCRSTGNWKEAFDSLIHILGKRLQAKALKIVEEEFGDETTIYQLTTAPNPEWRGEKGQAA